MKYSLNIPAGGYIIFTPFPHIMATVGAKTGRILHTKCSDLFLLATRTIVSPLQPPNMNRATTSNRSLMNIRSIFERLFFGTKWRFKNRMKKIYEN